MPKEFKFTKQAKENINNMTKFLKYLYSPSWNKGWMGLWIRETTRTRWLKAGYYASIALLAEGYSLEGRNVYFNVCLRNKKLGINKRGSLNDIGYVPGFWAEIDFKSEAHKAQNLPTPPQALKFIHDVVPIKPSIIVKSGNGYHFYWVFHHPLRVTKLNRKKVKKLWYNFGHYLVVEGKKRGYKIDNVCDLPRALRMPYTTNKKGKNIQPSRVVRYGTKYNIKTLKSKIAKIISK